MRSSPSCLLRRALAVPSVHFGLPASFHAYVASSRPAPAPWRSCSNSRKQPSSKHLFAIRPHFSSPTLPTFITSARWVECASWPTIRGRCGRPCRRTCSASSNRVQSAQRNTYIHASRHSTKCSTDMVAVQVVQDRKELSRASAVCYCWVAVSGSSTMLCSTVGAVGSTSSVSNHH